MWIEYYFLFLTAIWYWTLTYENQFHDVKNLLILRYYFKCPGVLPGCWETQSLSNKNSAGVEAAEGNKQNSKYSITQKYLILTKIPNISRHEDPGDAAVGHTAHAGKCSSPLLLCLLHLRDYRGAAVGGAAQTALLHQWDLPAQPHGPGGLQPVREISDLASIRLIPSLPKLS